MPFNASQELGKSISEPYEQPLYDITNQTIEKWNESRIGTEEEIKPTDTIIFLADTIIICVIKEFNWLCNSHVRLVKTVAPRPHLQIFDDF
ncbi:hypothetical protein ACOSQ3_032325 [Xanthoceras sorbifolium]